MAQRIIFHIDVNSAFLSWTAAEKLKNGDTQDLRLIPSIIGGDQATRHGVVLAKSVPAKKYGIQTGEPVVNALKKCPILVIEPPSHNLYDRRSEELMALLGTYTPDIEQTSVDECFLDFTGISHTFSSPLEAAHIIKDRVREELSFTVNIGISSNKLLAKMASDFQKPDKVHTLFPEEIKEKMWPLPVGDLFMAGRASTAVLYKLDIHTIGDLAAADPALLEQHLKSHGRRLWAYARGIDDAKVDSAPREIQGIGNSTTLATDVDTVEAASKILLKLAEKVGERLRKAGKKAGMISVEIKYSDFQSVSHQEQCTPTQSTAVLHADALVLFQELWNGMPLRLLGIRTSKLTDENAPEQLNLFTVEWGGGENSGAAQKKLEKQRKQETLDRVVDGLRDKFGKDAVQRAGLKRPATPPEKEAEKGAAPEADS